MKYKLNKIQKAGIAIGLTLTLAVGGFAIQIKNMFDFPEYEDTNIGNNSYYEQYDNTYQPPTQTENSENISSNTQITSDYINTPEINELRIYTDGNTIIPIQLTNYNQLNFLNSINDTDIYKYGQYFKIEQAMDLYNNTTINKSSHSSLLNEKKQLDVNKLIEQVEKNNENYLSNEKNAVSIFYKELDRQTITEICKKIVDVANTEYNDIEVEKLANTLSNLKILKKTSTSSNAYVSSDLAFIYNPNATDMYADVNKITGKYENEEESKDSVIIHEIMHLLEYAASDNNAENGIEAGICRMYNVPGKQNKLAIDSLWNSWILEAGAELGMSDYLDIETGTYAKKISYAKSYNLSRFNELGTKNTALENVVFNPTLEEAFKELKITDEKSQLDFLKYLYSVEITQYSTDDFWNNFMAETGRTYTEEEKTQIKMEIRSDAIKYLSINFYSNLADAITDKKISDLNTVFYMMRTWELDVYSHLEYTKTKSFEPAKEYIEWQYNTQQQLFAAIAESNNMKTEEITALYDEYYLQSSTNEKIQENCNLNKYDQYTKKYITSAKNEYNVSKYSRIKDVYTYIQKSKNNSQETNITK